MKVLAIFITLFVLSVVEAGRRHHRGHQELQELCQGDDACIENGVACFRSLKTVIFKRHDSKSDRKEDKKEKIDACLEQTNLAERFNEFAPQEEVFDEETPNEETPNEETPYEETPNEETPNEEESEQSQPNRDGERRDRHMGRHGCKGHKEGKRKLKEFMRTLEETDPAAASAFRCCKVNHMEIVNDGVLDKDMLKEQIAQALTDPSEAERRDAFIAAVDTCGDLDDCKVKDYSKCLVRTCIESQ